MEIIRREPLLILDGAHNPHAMVALGAALKDEFPTTRFQLVLGVMTDKDLGQMLGSLDGAVLGVHAAAADSDRARDLEQVATLAGEALGVPARTHDSVAEALTAATATGDAVLVTGSLYVVGEARDALGL
jgi:dihydrofolate synthase/folylpolyglutamate synthase